MEEQFIRFTTKGGWSDENDITVVARVYGDKLTVNTIYRVKNAIVDYKWLETKGDWDRDGCLDAAKKQLEKEGYKVEWIKADVEIDF